MLWRKALLYLVQTVAQGVIWQQFDEASEIAGTASTAGDADAQTWRRFTFHVANTQSSDTADDQSFSIDIANITNGQLDSTWTDADYATVQANLINLSAGLRASIVTWLTIDRLDAYVRAFNPYSNPKPFADSGAPEKTWPVAHVGTGGPTIAPQVCTTITELTPSRANWGRLYTPTIGPDTFTAAGRIGVGTIGNLTALFQGVYQSLMTAEFYPVVPTTQVAKAPVRTLQVVTWIRMDDVADNMRSRRWKTAATRTTLPTPAAAELLPADPVPATASDPAL